MSCVPETCQRLGLAEIISRNPEKSAMMVDGLAPVVLEHPCSVPLHQIGSPHELGMDCIVGKTEMEQQLRRWVNVCVLPGLLLLAFCTSSVAQVPVESPLPQQT